jgi:phosphoribosyl-ATP pyrophosphohydrolase/phosphoribosyl-AMP cyclohydrolase
MSLGLDDIDSLDWNKAGGLMPGVVQDARSEAVLMLGFLSPESLRETFLRGRVVFYSRTRQRLWEKGETSGNTLELVSIEADCDHDSLLLRVRHGTACHRQTVTCFGDGDRRKRGWRSARLDAIIQRITERPKATTRRGCLPTAHGVLRRKSARKALKPLWRCCGSEGNS